VLSTSPAQDKIRRPSEAVAVKLDLESTSGPVLSKTFSLPINEIKIGRDDHWADFVVPDDDDLNAVAGRHLTLERQASGDWIAVRTGKYYFNVRGAPVEFNAALASGETILLGKQTGPKLTFSLVFDTAGGQRSIRPTGEQDPIVPAWRIALSKHARKVYPALGALAVAVIALSIMQWIQWQRLDALYDEVETALTDQTAHRQPAGGFDEEAIPKLQRAAYMVLDCKKGAGEPCSASARQRGIATAWALEPKLLVTNIHVARVIDEARRSGDEICVRGYMPERENPPVASPGKTALSPAYCVESWIPHPGKALFDEAMRTPLGGWPPDSDEFKEDTRPGAYDVALLVMRDAVPADTTLELAPTDEIMALDAGEPLAFAGYMLRNSDGRFSASFDPVPVVHFGNVSRVTDFLMFSGEKETRQLIHNTIPITGGSSGGPVINRAGKVVAIVSAGSVVPIPKHAELDSELAPSASLVNYAQRADLVWQLWKPEQAFDAEAARKAWDAAAARYAAPRETVAADTLFRIKPKLGEGFAPAGGKPIAGRLDKWPSAKIFSYSFAAGKDYMVLAYSDRTDAMRLKLMDSEECLADGRWPALFLRADTDMTAELAVISRAAVERSYEIIVYEKPAGEAARSSASSAPAISCID
jgi:hypothetical protein